MKIIQKDSKTTLSLKYKRRMMKNMLGFSTFLHVLNVQLLKKINANFFKLSRTDDIVCVQYGKIILGYSGIGHTCFCVS